MAKESFRCLLVCRHVIIVDTDLPWEFWCPTCKSVQKVQHNKQITSDSPVHRLPRRRWGR